jgi:hypothetical protein
VTAERRPGRGGESGQTGNQNRTAVVVCVECMLGIRPEECMLGDDCIWAAKPVQTASTGSAA